MRCTQVPLGAFLQREMVVLVSLDHWTPSLLRVAHLVVLVTLSRGLRAGVAASGPPSDADPNPPCFTQCYSSEPQRTGTRGGTSLDIVPSFSTVTNGTPRTDGATTTP